MQNTTRINPNINNLFDNESLKINVKRNSARGGIITIVAQLLKFTFSTGSTIFLARILTPNDFGIFGMVTAVTGFIGIFKDLGLSTATIQRNEINQKQISNLFWLNTIFGILATVLLSFLAPVISWFYQNEKLFPIIISLSIAFIFSGLSAQHQALLTRQMRFLDLAIIDITSVFSSILVGILVAWYGYGYWSLVIMQVELAFANFLGTWIASSWVPNLPTRKSGIRSMVLYGSNITGFSIVNYLSRNVDNILIGKFWGTVQLGIYSKAYQLLLLPLQQINAPVNSVALPALSRLVDNPDEFRKLYLKAVSIIAILTIPFIAFMMGTSDWLISLILGPQWKDASTIFSVLGIAALTQPVNNTTGNLFITLGRSRQLFNWGMVASALTILSIIVGLPWGSIGVAISYAITNVLILSPLLYWYIGKHTPIVPYDFYKVLIPNVAISTTIYLIIIFLRKSDYFPKDNNILGIFLSLIITIICLGMFCLLTKSGRETYNNFQLIFDNFKLSKNSKSLV